MTRISIIILTYNQRHYTLRCLDALSPFMTAHPDAEVVLVDNGSTDSTLPMVMQRDYTWQARIVTLPQSSNLGVAAGRNAGLRHASGQLLMLLDNDTVPSADTLEALFHYIDTHPEVGVAAPALISPQGELQASAKPFPGLMVKIRHALLRNEVEAPDPNPYYVIGACQAFRREVLERVGELDSRIFYGPEDADFCARVRNAGLEIHYLPHLRLIHDWQRATTRRLLSPLGRRHIRGLIHFWLKHRRFL